MKLSKGYHLHLDRQITLLSEAPRWKNEWAETLLDKLGVGNNDAPRPMSPFEGEEGGPLASELLGELGTRLGGGAMREPGEMSGAWAGGGGGVLVELLLVASVCGVAGLAPDCLALTPMSAMLTDW